MSITFKNTVTPGKVSILIRDMVKANPDIMQLNSVSAEVEDKDNKNQSNGKPLTNGTGSPQHTGIGGSPNGTYVSEKPIANGIQTPYSSQAELTPVELEVGYKTSSDVHEKKKNRRHRDPVFICKWIAARPKLCFALTLFGHILFLIITFLLVQVGYDVLPITFDRLPLNILDDVDYLRDMASQNVWDADGVVARVNADEGNGTTPTLTEAVDYVELVFYTENGNVLTKKNLKAIQDVENSIFDDKDFKNDYCKKDETNKCVRPNSIMQYFDGTWKDLDPIFDDPNFDNIEAVINRAYDLDETKASLVSLLGKETEITASSVSAKGTRSSFQFGGPLEGYQNTTDREDEQSDKLERYMARNFISLLDSYYSDGVGDMDFVYYSGKLLGSYITRQVVMDMALAIGSVCFIVIFMCIQTGSLFTTCFAILSILTAFCCANLIYRCILDFRYFGVFHVLAVFIILGIGADDIFVFFDNWKATAHYTYPSLAHRLSDCYRKASLAMLFTSLTTAIAFIVSAASPFLGISSFGVFAGILVCVNYISVIVFFPCVVVIYHLYFEKYKCCCCCPRNTHLPDPVNEDPALAHKRKHPVVRFFRGPYYKVVTHKIVRWVILCCFLVLMGVSIYYATQIEVNEEQVKFLPEDTNFGKFIAVRNEVFDSTTTGGGTQINLVWGLQQQDLSSCHKTDASCTGETVWDNSFHLNSAESQQALADFCQRIKSMTDTETESLMIARDIVTNEPGVKCFIHDMDTFYTSEEQKTTKYPVGTDLNMPFTQAKAERVMDSNPFLGYDKSKLPATFEHYLPIMASFWLYNGFSSPGPQFSEYGIDLVEVETANTQTAVLQLPNGMEMEHTYGNRLGMMRVEVNTTLTQTMGFTTGLEIRENWEQWMTKEMSSMPDELQNGYQVSGGIWHWLKVQKVLASTAVNGVIIGLCIAFPILVIATHNIIVGFMATITICTITVSVLGVIPMAGWKLGVLESLNLVLVVGLAVDYVVHLAEGYARSAHDDRLGRVHDMLEEVGISVLSGAVSTLGSSVFLLLAEILFFSQFGLFMFSTIGFSILYALGLFTVCLALFGPQGNTGSLLPLYAWINKKCCCCCKKDSEKS